MFIHQLTADVIKFPITTREDCVIVLARLDGHAHGQQYPGPHPMNTDRIYQGEDEHWYFNVRGNIAKGPFATRADAEASLTQHVRQWHRPLGSSPWPRVLKVFGDTRRSEPRHT